MTAVRPFPSYPSFDSLWLATAADLPRMAALSVLGFKDSEIFRYERLLYDEFPEDAIASFVENYRSQLEDPRAVVVVVEDWKQSADEASASKDRVVVGVANWIFPKGSPRTGQFVVPDIQPHSTPHRDLHQGRLELFTRITEATEKKYFTGKMICNKLVVHPSYQGHGHGTTMLQWGQRLSMQDAVNQGVIPSHMSERVYLGLGYEIIGEMIVPDNGEAKGFTQRVVLFRGIRAVIA